MSGEPLMVVGAGGLGLEVAWLAQRAGHRVIGFLDDNVQRGSGNALDLPVLGPVDEWQECPETLLAVAIGSPHVKRDVVARLQATGRPQFATLIDPSAVVHRDVVHIGAGSIIAAGAVCTVDVVIGEHVLLDRGAMLGHGCRVSRFCSVAPLAALSGDVLLEEAVSIGAGACVRQGLRLGRGAVLGMGAVLVRDADDGAVLVGNPARPISPR